MCMYGEFKKVALVVAFQITLAMQLTEEELIILVEIQPDYYYDERDRKSVV